MWKFLKNLERELSYDPAILLLGIHMEKNRIERDTGTPMFIAALFVIARTGTYTQWSITRQLKRIYLNQF